MKKIIAILLIFIILVSLSACKKQEIDPYEVLSKFEIIVETLGNSQITKDSDLIGTRENTDDNKYIGLYTSNCENETGRDVIFGGASTKEQTLRIFGNIKTDEGTAILRIRLGENIEFPEIDENGNFDFILSLNGGGNYIMIDYENFIGSVTLTSEYSEI